MGGCLSDCLALAFRYPEQHVCRVCDSPLPLRRGQKAANTGTQLPRSPDNHSLLPVSPKPAAPDYARTSSLPSATPPASLTKQTGDPVPHLGSGEAHVPQCRPIESSSVT